MNVFDGNYYAKELEKEIHDFTNSSKKFGKLLFIQIGDNKASEKYIALKQKLCEKYFIPTELMYIENTKSDSEIRNLIVHKMHENDIQSAILQLPLPRKSLNNILDLIPMSKDIDRLSSTSQEQFYSKKFSKLSPIVRALKLFLETNSINVKNMPVFIIGSGYLVGKPVDFYLSTLGAHVTVINNYRTGTKLNCQLLVLSAGTPNLVNAKDIANGCHVVDFGSSVVDEKVVGDLTITKNNLSEASHLGVISLSPGGMGPLVVRYLVMNHLGI